MSLVKRVLAAIKKIDDATLEFSEAIDCSDMEHHDVEVEILDHNPDEPWIRLWQGIDEVETIVLRTRSEAERVVREIRSLIPRLTERCGTCRAFEYELPLAECTTPEVHREDEEEN